MLEMSLLGCQATARRDTGSRGSVLKWTVLGLTMDPLYQRPLNLPQNAFESAIRPSIENGR